MEGVKLPYLRPELGTQSIFPFLPPSLPPSHSSTPTETPTPSLATARSLSRTWCWPEGSQPSRLKVRKGGREGGRGVSSHAKPGTARSSSRAWV